MTNKQKEQRISNLLKLNGFNNNVTAQMQNTFHIAEKIYPDIRQEDIENVKNKYSYNNYKSKIVMLYSSIFTDEEILAMEKFWSSSAGKKLTSGIFAQKEQQLAIQWIADIKSELQEMDKVDG